MNLGTEHVDAALELFAALRRRHPAPRFEWSRRGLVRDAIDGRCPISYIRPYIYDTSIPLNECNTFLAQLALLGWE